MSVIAVKTKRQIRTKMPSFDMPAPSSRTRFPHRLTHAELKALVAKCPEHLFSTDASQLKPLG